MAIRSRVCYRGFSINDPETGERLSFVPGNRVPKRIQDLVTNPKIFEAPEVEEVEDEDDEEFEEFEDEGDAPDEDDEDADEGGGDQALSADELRELTVAQLKEVASERHIDISGITKKVDLVSAIVKG